MPVIAVDAMGGDHAPEEIVRGVAEVSLETDIDCLLVGDEGRVQAVLEEIAYNPERIAVLHARDAVADGRGRARGDADAQGLVPHGRARGRGQRARRRRGVGRQHAGPAVLAASRCFSLLPGIRRAALACVYPRLTEYPGQDPLALLLDVGATVHCEADELVHFALMGSAYARRISKVPNPRVGLLNIGVEETKGGPHAGRGASPAARPAHDRLRRQRGGQRSGARPGRRHRVRGLRRERGAEAAGRRLGGVGRRRAARRRSASWCGGSGSGSCRAASSACSALTDFSRYGGAPILGFDKLFIKCHGRSQARAVANAVKVAAKAVRDRVPDEIADARRRSPVSLRGRRRAAPAPAALLCRWDLDKTYLRSEFDTLRQLWRTARERGEDKVAVPGVIEVLKGLRAAADRHGRPITVLFVSASPPQIGQAIRDKLAPRRRAVRRHRVQGPAPATCAGASSRNLREHAGFKLGRAAPRPRRQRAAGARGAVRRRLGGGPAHLLALRRRAWPAGCRSKRSGRFSLRVGVDPAAVPDLCRTGGTRGGAGRCRPHLHQPGAADAARVVRAHSAPRLAPTFNYFQTALMLAADGWLDPEDVVAVASGLVTRAGYTQRRLDNSLGRPGPPPPAVDLPRAPACRTRRDKRDCCRRRPRRAWITRLRAMLSERRTAAARAAVRGALDWDDILARHRPARGSDREAGVR